VDHRGFGAFLEANLGAPRANLRAFAAELAALLAAPHVTLTNAGSSANLAAALALAELFPRGSRAIVSGFTFPTTVASLLTAGFDVRVADIEPGGFCLDPEAAKHMLDGPPGVLCVTHFLGFPARIDELCGLARERGWLVLQDACETMSLEVAGRPVHARGTLTTWSFYHPHHLSAFGGGAVVSLDAPMRRRLESLTHWGRACTCHVDGLACAAPDGIDHQFHYVRTGHNLEMSELNACFGRWQLATWHEQEARRRHHWRILESSLSGLPGLTTWRAPADTGTPFVFPLASDRRDELSARLRHRGVEVRSLMGGVVTAQPAYRGLPSDGLARARELSRTGFFLGIHQTLAEEDVRAVAAIVAEEASR
jgi:dTDP-4-amino-4,6-dideoxygalactose transaminase